MEVTNGLYEIRRQDSSLTGRRRVDWNEACESSTDISEELKFSNKAVTASNFA
jgi:hypothetical protein